MAITNVRPYPPSVHFHAYFSLHATVISKQVTKRATPVSSVTPGRLPVSCLPGLLRLRSTLRPPPFSNGFSFSSLLNSLCVSPLILLLVLYFQSLRSTPHSTGAGSAPPHECLALQLLKRGASQPGCKESAGESWSLGCTPRPIKIRIWENQASLFSDWFNYNS